MIDESLLTVTEAAQMARISKQTVLRRAREGCFPTYRYGPRGVRVSRLGFRRWLFGPDADRWPE
jgi:excisionase family DNA binding protein